LWDWEDDVQLQEQIGMFKTQISKVLDGKDPDLCYEMTKEQL